jgi:hypothetical protein
MKNLSVLFLLVALLPACSRKAEKTALEDAAVIFGPTAKDVKLDLSPRSPEALKNDLRIEGEVSTANYLRLAEDLKKISEAQASPAVERLSRKMIESFNGQPHSSVSLSNSLYLNAIIGEGEPEVQKQLSSINKEIKSSINTLTGLLDASQKTYPWPKKLENLPAAISATDDYAVWLVEQIGKQKLDPSIAKPIQAAIKSEYGKYRPRVVKAVDSLQRAKKLGQATQVLKAVTKEFGFDLGQEGNTQLKKAEKLAASIAGVTTAQNALTLIVEIWRMTPPADRKAVFASVPEIYDYLDGKDELSLACLAAPICPNPIIMVPKRLVILPKISSYGVENIKNQVDSAARDYLVDQVREQAVGFLPQIPVMVKGAVLTEAKKYQSLVASIQKDFPGFAKKSFTAWSEENFTAPIRGLEADSLSWKLLSSGDIKLAMKKSAKGTVESGAETLGLSLATAHEFLPEEKSSRLKAALVAPLLKLLAISGFRKPGGQTFASLLYPLDGPKEQVFNIKDLLKGRTSFAVPDTFVASEGFAMNRDLSAPRASVGAQAELLRGISRQIRFHRDWEKNLFDEKLGVIQVEDVVKEVPRGSVNFSVFPKDVVFALSVGSAGAILQNIILDLSPAFLMLGEKELLWGNDYEKIGEGKISTVAGLVNIENGQRGRTVKTADVARYILALDEFLSATEGIENTKAAPLLEKNADGETVVEQLVEARRYLRLFQMGLTNFLVYVAQDKKDGGFQSTYTLSADGATIKGEGPRLLADQVLAIRALVVTADRLEMPLYSWSALDGYYFMNRSLWDKQTQFYASAVGPGGNQIGSPNVMEIAATLRGIEELTPRMTGEVKGQWQQIAKPWLRALEDF